MHRFFLALATVACLGSTGSAQALIGNAANPAVHRTGMDPYSGSQGERLGLTPSAVTGPVSPSRHATVGIEMKRQASVAWAAAYNAQMLPYRIANAEKARARKAEESAERRRRAEERLATIRSEQQLKAAFAEKARDWTDSTLRYTVSAILVEADESNATFQKRDGKVVVVPLYRLCFKDRSWIEMNVLGK